MCTKLRELEEALARVAGDFDPTLVSAAEAEGVMERAARIEHMAATVKALAAARMAETELWSLGGDRSPAHMLARRTGQTVSGAAQQLENAKRLADHPKTDAAARKGTLSPQQAAAITDAVFKAARADGRHEPTEAYAFDALMALAAQGDDAPRARSGTTKVLVRVDFETLFGGHPADGEVCEIAGYGPVPVSVVTDLLAPAQEVAKGFRFSCQTGAGR
jgi:hypothetical protein